MYFNDIAAMLSGVSWPITTPNEYIVGGRWQSGDGGGGTFIWMPASDYIPYNGILIPVQDNGIIFYHPSNATGSIGCFKRVFSGAINVRWFGAILGANNGASVITDVTPYVHAARDSEAFADNGTLYFPKGEYPGAFEFFHNSDHNEINLIGDGKGTVLKSNGTSSGIYNNPVLRLGWRDWHWMWAKVSNLMIDGSWQSTTHRFSYGVWYENLAPDPQTNLSGRWVFEKVTFINCDRGIYKPTGNIGNHYIDCTWYANNYGVYANGLVDYGMHSGCDRYSGGHFARNELAALRYVDNIGGNGQIIVDGTVIEQNSTYGITIYCADAARMTWNAICLRNVWFEANGHNNGADVKFEGVRSVRIDDSNVSSMILIESSVNLFNCRHTGVFDPGREYAAIKIDEKSSLVAYEQRYPWYPSDKIYVNSISYDGSPYNSSFEPTSVWGPLRAVTATRDWIVITTHFDQGPEPFENNLPPHNHILDSSVTSHRVLGDGSGLIYMPNHSSIRSTNVIGVIPNDAARYCVWSIHTFLEMDLSDGQFYGSIISEDGSTQLGNVYFKYNQWACSYGMKLIDRRSEPLRMRLVFTSFNSAVKFRITDYQILVFDDLASANSFVNSRAFAIYPFREE